MGEVWAAPIAVPCLPRYTYMYTSTPTHAAPPGKALPTPGRRQKPGDARCRVYSHFDFCTRVRGARCIEHQRGQGLTPARTPRLSPPAWGGGGSQHLPSTSGAPVCHHCPRCACSGAPDHTRDEPPTGHPGRCVWWCRQAALPMTSTLMRKTMMKKTHMKKRSITLATFFHSPARRWAARWRRKQPAM